MLWIKKNLEVPFWTQEVKRKEQREDQISPSRFRSAATDIYFNMN